MCITLEKKPREILLSRNKEWLQPNIGQTSNYVYLSTTLLILIYFMPVFLFKISPFSLLYLNPFTFFTSRSLLSKTYRSKLVLRTNRVPRALTNEVVCYYLQSCLFYIHKSSGDFFFALLVTVRLSYLKVRTLTFLDNRYGHHRVTPLIKTVDRSNYDKHVLLSVVFLISYSTEYTPSK